MSRPHSQKSAVSPTSAPADTIHDPNPDVLCDVFDIFDIVYDTLRQKHGSARHPNFRPELSKHLNAAFSLPKPN